MLPKSVQDLIKEFAKLPGVGMKTAARLTFYLLGKDQASLAKLGQSVLNLKSNLKECRKCYNISEDELCKICQDESRDGSTICVVSDPLDVVAIEKSKKYQGLYHILGGVISPIDGIGPEQLRIRELLDRINNDNKIKEIILATDPDLEGEATSLYLQKQIQKISNVKISRIAKGLPTGGDIEYADETTLDQAFANRQILDN
jgi:recombination protein RecR